MANFLDVSFLEADVQCLLNRTPPRRPPDEQFPCHFRKIDDS